jgi:hypothetical protein
MSVEMVTVWFLPMSPLCASWIRPSAACVSVADSALDEFSGFVPMWGIGYFLVWRIVPSWVLTHTRAPPHRPSSSGVFPWVPFRHPAKWSAPIHHDE